MSLFGVRLVKSPSFYLDVGANDPVEDSEPKNSKLAAGVAST